MMSFEWPWQYNFPPFFTLQPNVDTRQKQLTAWCSLVLSYCRLNKLYTMTVAEAQESSLFNNRKLQRKLPLESILVVLEELRKKGNLEWLDKNKSSFLVLWRRLEEWSKLIYQWVSKNGLTNSVFTLYELSNGDDTETEDQYGHPPASIKEPRNRISELADWSPKAEKVKDKSREGRWLMDIHSLNHRPGGSAPILQALWKTGAINVLSEFHGLEESLLLRALQALQQEHKAEIITLDDGRGVKFF